MIRNGTQRRFPMGIPVLGYLFMLASCGCDFSPKPPGDVASRPATISSEITTTPLASSFAPEIGPLDPTPLFEKLSPSHTGIDFVHRWRPRDQFEAALLKTPLTGGGVCLGDYDDDGLCDLYFTRPHGGGRLLRNVGDFKFQDTTSPSGVEDDETWTTGATFVDANNDGLLDLFVCAYESENRLFLNRGNSKFQDAAPSAGLSFVGASLKMVFADYDRDGDLDAYLVTNRREPREPPKIRYLGGPGHYSVAEEHRELVGVINLPSGEQKFTKAGQFDHLYRNELTESGELRFVEVSREAGIDGNYHGLDATWWDYDGDGDPDLYVANDFTDPDQLYRNNGDGSFTDVTRTALPHTPWFTMGAAAGDVNNDGRLDLFATDMAGTTHYREKIAMGSMEAVAWFLDTAEPRQYMRNALFLNTGTPRFMEIAHLAGVASSDWTWSVKLADLDNDGREDIFVTNGFTRDYLDSDFNQQLRQRGLEQSSLAWYDAPELRERNIALRNLGDYRFASVADKWGLDELGISFGAALGDLDGDGDLDLVVNNFDAAPSVYRNRSTAGHRVKIRLRGSTGSSIANRDGIGATVHVDTSAGRHVRYHALGSGYMSSNEPLVYCGLGRDTTIRRLTVLWPNGRRQSFEDLPADRCYVITEPTQSAAPPVIDQAPAQSAATWFTESDLFSTVRHRETPYDDFQSQPLLPNKLSQLGPGMAWADVDGDGDDDLFVGGAAKQAGQLLICQDDGSFAPHRVSALEQDALSEDMGCLFFDADSDGDEDLYVVSGGVEGPPGDEVYRDRLYRNEGTDTTGGPRFVRVAGALPDLRESGSVVAGADVDRDGDLDLFVGGRVNPGAYPTSPPSRLLENNGGQFTDATSSRAGGLMSAGMVTGAIWSDADSDGWIDLLVTVEYGPIRFFHNEHGQLVEKTNEAGTAKLLGWWNGIDACDVDSDGDVDYVVTNLGLNTKYQPSAEKPQVLFYGDFENAGRKRIVEAKPGSTGLLPVRGKSCSQQAMPFLQEKFTTFRAFASASLSDIYGDQCLNDASRWEATVAASGILINDGAATFTFRSLPRLAQAAPGFGVQFFHVDGDAHPDLFIAQNFFGPQRETGRMDGGVGLLLTGNGDGTFQPVWPDKSGIVIPDDATAASAVDVNHDGQPDLVVAVNDGSPRTFVRRGLPANTVLALRLRGKPGNLSACGTRVRLVSQSGRVTAAETYACHGYLTQSPSEIRFSIDATDPPAKLDITWPRGATTQRPVRDGERRIVVTEP